MTQRGLGRLHSLALILLVLVGLGVAIADQHATQIAYWRERFPELKPADDARAATAHAIFERLVQVAGKRPGVVPRLFITARDPWEMTLPIAIRDGWIILSAGVLNICYQEPTRGKDRLAFVLAHELAHQLKDDLWHMRFFDAYQAAQTQTAVAPAFLDELRRSTQAIEHVLAREVQADEQGIIYMAMAGFHPNAIVLADQGVNFFVDWVRALDPRRLTGVAVDSVRPTPQERADALRAALRRIADQTAAFQAGLWFYYAGDYPQAMQAFDHFRTVYAGREVYHNLATSYHQLALQAYRAWPSEAQTFPFHLSLTIEPLTRASQIYLERTRRANRITSLHQPLEAAIRWYREALAQEAAYTPAALNLGAALILRGAQTPQSGFQPDFSEAVAILSRALERAPQSPELLNNLGVALFYEERLERAQAALSHARTLAPTYAAPVFNLGAMAHIAHHQDEAQRYQQVYAQLVASPGAAMPIRREEVETVDQVIPGAPEENVAARWGKPTRRTVRVEGKTWSVAAYPAGVMTLAQQGEILMLLVQEGYQGATARGIMLGSSGRDVRARYGPPTRHHELAPGHNWAYDDQRIAFQLRDGKVVSWLRF